MAGQVNVSIQLVSRSVLSAGCAHRCDGSVRPVCRGRATAGAQEVCVGGRASSSKFSHRTQTCTSPCEGEMLLLFVKEEQKSSDAYRRHARFCGSLGRRDVLAKCPRSDRFLSRPLTKPHQRRSDNRLHRSLLQTCESWCGNAR